MPEGDAVYRFAAKLRSALAGRVIESARSHGPGPVVRVEKIIGATCNGVDTFGKNLFIRFDNGLALRGHLRMYGSWHVYAPGEPWQKAEHQARLVLEVAGAVVVNFSAPVIELIEQRAIEVYRPIASLGPDLLADDFDEDEAFRRFREAQHGERFIGDAIMDQKLMAGVGNIWKHETLFRCGIYPWRRIKDMDDDTLRGLIVRARGLLLLSIGRGDGTRPAQRPSMFVYMRGGQPCRRCYARLLSAVQGPDIRRTSWCPKCQPKRQGEADPPYEAARQASRY